jgi:hypothetical protein
VNPGLRCTSLGVTAAMKTLLSNANEHTLSVWFKHMTYPSNATYVGLDRPTGIPGTNITNQFVMLAALKSGSSAGSTDGRPSLLYRTNGQIEAYIRTRGGVSSLVGLLTNQADRFNTLAAPYSNWNYHALYGNNSNGATPNRVYLTVNDQTHMVHSSPTTTFQANNPTGLFLFGGETGGNGAPYFANRASPWGWGDEFRYSIVSRSSNWLMTEFSNTISTTNMGLFNGAVASQIGFVSNAIGVAFTNLTPLMAQGQAFRGYHFSPLGIQSTRLIISNSSGEAYNQAASLDSLTAWSATPIIPTGVYTAYVITSNSNGLGTNAAPFNFTLVIASTLTVKSVSSTGAPWVGGRIAGPSPTLNIIDGLKTNDANGEVVFPNQNSSATIALTNFTPVAWGGAFLVTNFVMPESNLILTWVFDSTTPPATATNASMRLDSVAFAPSQAAFLRLSIPQASNATVRVVVSATPLAGGRRVSVFDGSASPANPNIQIPAETLRAFMHPGTWILEFQFPRTGTDRSKVITTRRLLFYFQ